MTEPFSARELDPHYDIEDFLAPGSIPDLNSCDREPIHLSGAIQPHGVLLAVDDDFRVRTASANAGPVLGTETAALFGASLTDWLTAGSTADLLAALADDSGPAFEPLDVETVAGGSFELIWHRMKDLLVIELEPAEAPPKSVAALFREFSRALTALQAAGDVQTLCEAAATQIRRLTGYDRVMVYRFHPDWHGEVVAEAHGSGMVPFLENHYPASDIPRQARKLYQLNHLRVIVDANYQPVPLLAAAGDERGELNLSLSGLRSVSPIHLQYLRNMGVEATMTLSLMIEDQLWGMISCHHRTTKQVGAQLRATCRILGQTVGIGIAALAERDRRAHRDRLSGDLRLIIDAMAGAESLAAGLVGADRSSLGLTAADGLVARIDGQRVTLGSVPPDDVVDSLLESLRAADSLELICDDLPARSAPFEEFAGLASGVMALRLAADSSDHVTWFRREWVRTLSWGGNPDKPMTEGPVDEGGQRTSGLHPRESFDSWLQEVRGRSRPWLPAEIDTARSLARSIPDLQLSRARPALLAGREAELANNAKNEFLSRMSHELRTPLNAVLGFAQLLELDDLGADQMDAVRHILRGGRHLLGLIDDVLDISKIESDRLEMSLELVPASRLITETVELMAPMAAAEKVRLYYESSAASDRAVRADHRRLRQVILNLLSNAIKYNRPGGRVDVSCAITADTHLNIIVADSGRGIRTEHLPRLFVPFDRLDAAASEIEGTGVGLALSYRLMTLMGGTLSAESEYGVGSVFTASIPMTSNPTADSVMSTLPPQDIPELDRPQLPTRTMLYVEDNSSNIELMERVVTRRPEWTMVVAGHGALGLELAAGSPPDLMLLDLHLPDMEGITVLRRLRSDPRTAELAVVVISADASPHQIQRLLAAGAQAYLTKPLVVPDVLALLDSVDGSGPDQAAAVTDDE